MLSTNSPTYHATLLPHYIHTILSKDTKFNMGSGGETNFTTIYLDFWLSTSNFYYINFYNICCLLSNLQSVEQHLPSKLHVLFLTKMHISGNTDSNLDSVPSYCTVNFIPKLNIVSMYATTSPALVPRSRLLRIFHHLG